MIHTYFCYFPLCSYDAADDLDFMPMNQFQRQFWLLRQSEQESYNYQYAPLKPRLVRAECHSQCLIPQNWHANTSKFAC